MNPSVRMLLLGGASLLACADPLEPTEPPDRVQVQTSFTRAMVLFRGHDCNASSGTSLCAIECEGVGSSCETSPSTVRCACTAPPVAAKRWPDINVKPEPLPAAISSCGCEVLGECFSQCAGPRIASCDCTQAPPVCVCEEPADPALPPVVVLPLVVDSEEPAGAAPP